MCVVQDFRFKPHKIVSVDSEIVQFQSLWDWKVLFCMRCVTFVERNPRFMLNK